MKTKGASTNWQESPISDVTRIEALREAVNFWQQQYENILKDAERYRFIRNGGVNLINFVSEDPDIPVDVWAGTDPANRFIANTLDEAIDAAMREDKP